MRAWERFTSWRGWRRRLTPPAMAAPHSPRRRLSQARWIAVRDAEHAVSTARLGPVKSSWKETRLAMPQGLVAAASAWPAVHASAATHW